MKKRLISLLLTLVMLVSLCTAFGVSASADATVTTVTLKQGETVLSLCQKAGVDYYAHKNLIMKLNGLTAESQFSKLPVGSKVVIPVSNAAAVTLAGGTVTSAVTTGTTTAAAAAGTGFVSGSTTSIPAGDYVSYYLVGYTIQSGETINAIYNNWGLSYKTYSNQILKLNNLRNFNSIPAGKTLILPTTNPAMAGAVYTTVMAHVMRSGDSAYNIICSDYGLNYNTVQRQVQYLNNRENLAQFMIGEVLYIPVPGLLSANTTVTPGTGTGSGSSSSNATLNTSAAYNLVAQTPSNGSLSMMVDGVAATTAHPGKTVEIIASPNAGYALSGITVTKVGDSGTTVSVTGNKFVMPSYSVSVAVSFSQAVKSEIKIDAATNGSVSAMVNSKVVSSATAGNLVSVKTIPATGFMLDHIRVTYNNYRDTIAVENGQFTMPAFPVTVTASFKEDPSYNPMMGHNIYFDAAHGSVTAKVGSDSVTSAKKGDRVTLTVTPDANYTLQALSVYYDNFKKTLDVEKNAFTMPDGPVTVVATFAPTADAQFSLTKVHNSDGTIKLTVDGKEVESAKVGQKVKISATASKAFFNFIPSVFKTGDTSVTISVAEDGTFTMPDFPVTVSVKFYIYRNITLDASNGTNGWFNVVSAVNGKAYSKAGAGVKLKVTVWGYNKSLYAPGNVIITYADGSVHTLDGAEFIMPDCDIRVRVNFNPVQKLIAHSVTSPAKAGNSYTVLGKTLNDKKNYSEALNAGELNNVIITPNCAIGYEVDSIYYTYTDKYDVEQTVPVELNPVSGRYQFAMPTKDILKDKTNVHLYVKFREIVSYTIETVYNAENADHKMGTVTLRSSLGIVTAAPLGTKVQLLFAPGSGCSVDYPNVMVYTNYDKATGTGTPVELNRNDYTFSMPGAKVTVFVPFRSDMHSVKLALADTPEGDMHPKGFINAVVNGTKYTDDMLTAQRLLPVSVREGSTVTIINESREGFILNPEEPILVKRVHTGVPIKVSPVDGTIDRFTFEMPDDDVVVIAQYVDDMYTIISAPAEHGSYTAPKQAAYSATEAVSITNFSPERGYEVDDILLTYTDHKGTNHVKESIKNGSGYIDASGETVKGGFIPAGGGIPKSDVIVEVIFKPVRNPLTIQYVFDNTPDKNCNYSVDLNVDGKKVEDIDRGTFKVTGYSDKLDLGKSSDGKRDKGIHTGSTVIVTRQDFNKDENFDIVAMWVELNGTVVCPSSTNKDSYYFDMPYVDSRLTKDLVLYVRYAKHTDDGFNLVAVKAAGTGHNAKAEFKVAGKPSTIAKIDQEIVLTLTQDDHCCEIGTKVVMSYVNADNETIREEFTGITSGNTVTVTVPAGKIPSLPVSAVSFGYTSTPEQYTISFEDQDGNSPDSVKYYIDGVEGSDTPYYQAPWGSVVKVAPKWDGYVVKEIEVTGNTTGNKYDTNEGFIFEMPQEGVTVVATLVPATYKLDLVYSGNGSGEAKIMIGETVYANGAELPYGKEIKIVATPDASTDSKLISVTGKYVADNSDVTITTSGNEASFKIEKESAVKIDVKFDRNVHDLKHSWAIGSESSGYMLDGVAFDAVTNRPDPANPAKISVGIPVTIKPERGFTLKGLNASYTAKGDKSVNVSSFTSNADGSFSFVITEIPTSAVELKLSFQKVSAQYELIHKPAAEYTKGEIEVTPANGSLITDGKKVELTFKVRYDRVLDGKVAISYTTSDGTTLEYAEPTYDPAASTPAYAVYKASFNMPRADVTVEYRLKAQTRMHVEYDKTKCQVTGLIDNTWLDITTPIEVKCIATEAGKKFKGIEISYMLENETPITVLVEDDDGDNIITHAALSQIPMHGKKISGKIAADRLNLISFKAVYETIG